MKSNITLIALNDEYKKTISKNLSERLEMFYIDINELIEYNLCDICRVISLAGVEYYNEEERKTLINVSGYENTIINLSINTLLKNDYFEILKEKSLVIFLKSDIDDYKKLNKELNQKQQNNYNKKDFNEINKILNKKSDIIIEYQENTDILEEILNAIKEYYKEVL